MQIDAEAAINELVTKGIKLPAQPKVLLELQRKLASDDFSINELSRVIASDPGVSAMLFKVARSPVFGGTKKLDSIEQVLMLIGVKQTYNLIQAISLSSSINSSTRKSFDVFWNRSE